MNILLASTSPIWLEPGYNLAKIKNIIDTCAPQVDLIVFPEMCFTGFSPQFGAVSNSLLESILTSICDAARRASVAVIFGILAYKSNLPTLKPYNMAFAIGSDGNLLSTYSKIHCFSYAGEHLHVAQGDQPNLFKFLGFNFSLSICYDLRFPEVFSSISHKVDCYVNIASWPKVRENHWLSLMKARAIENQSIFIGVNRSGCDGNGLVYPDNSSKIFSPLGDEIQSEIVLEEVYSAISRYNLTLMHI